jgi:hypothetical protein
MITFRRPLFLWFFALLVSYVRGARPDETVEIVQRWIPGTTYTFTRTVHQEAEKTGTDGQNLKRIDENTSQTSAKAELEGGKQFLVIRVAHVVEKKEIGEQTFSYDSAKSADAKSPAPAEIGALLGKEFKIPLDEKGAPVHLATENEAVSPNGKNEVMGRINEFMRLIATPGHPVRPADQWPMHVSMETPFGIESVDGNLSLRSVGMHDGVRCAEIGEKGKISMRPDEKGNNAASGSPAATKIGIEDGEIVGTIWFDLGLGAVREIERNLSMTVTVTKRDPADSSKISTPVKQVVHAKLTKVEDSK